MNLQSTLSSPFERVSSRFTEIHSSSCASPSKQFVVTFVRRRILNSSFPKELRVDPLKEEMLFNHRQAVCQAIFVRSTLPLHCIFVRWSKNFFRKSPNIQKCTKTSRAHNTYIKCACFRPQFTLI